MRIVSEVPEYVDSYFKKLRAVDRDRYLQEKTDYWLAMMERDKLVNEHLDGDAHNLFKAGTPSWVKAKYNNYSTAMTKISVKALDSGAENVPELNLEFMRKDDVKVSAGWYQNAVGDLYHYDGVVWDTVPSERIQDLEFLGN